MAVNTKGKRKLVINGAVYYWFVRIERDGSHRIHILTADKKVNIVCPTADTEVPVTPLYIRKILEKSGKHPDLSQYTPDPETVP